MLGSNCSEFTVWVYGYSFKCKYSKFCLGIFSGRNTSPGSSV